MFKVLLNQTRSTSISIPFIIAEGAARRFNKEFIQFLYIAIGSNAEIELQLLVAKNLKYIDDVIFLELNKHQVDIARMLMGLIKYRKNKSEDSNRK